MPCMQACACVHVCVCPVNAAALQAPHLDAQLNHRQPGKHGGTKAPAGQWAVRAECQRYRGIHHAVPADHQVIAPAAPLCAEPNGKKLPPVWGRELRRAQQWRSRRYVQTETIAGSGKEAECRPLLAGSGCKAAESGVSTTGQHSGRQLTCWHRGEVAGVAAQAGVGQHSRHEGQRAARKRRRRWKEGRGGDTRGGQDHRSFCLKSWLELCLSSPKVEALAGPFIQQHSHRFKPLLHPAAPPNDVRPGNGVNESSAHSEA